MKAELYGGVCCGLLFFVFLDTTKEIIIGQKQRGGEPRKEKHTETELSQRLPLFFSPSKTFPVVVRRRREEEFEQHFLFSWGDLTCFFIIFFTLFRHTQKERERYGSRFWKLQTDKNQQLTWEAIQIACLLRNKKRKKRKIVNVSVRRECFLSFFLCLFFKKSHRQSRRAPETERSGRGLERDECYGM